jgi:hypothetical protein
MLLFGLWDIKASRFLNGSEGGMDILASSHKQAPDDHAGPADTLTAVHCHVLSRVERIADVVGQCRDRLSGHRQTAVANWECSEVYAAGRGSCRLAFQNQLRFLLGLEEGHHHIDPGRTPGSGLVF